VYCYQPALNSDDVINMNLTLSVLLALCVSRLFFFLQALFTVHLDFVLGTLCMLFYAVQFPVYQSKC